MNELKNHAENGLEYDLHKTLHEYFHLTGMDNQHKSFRKLIIMAKYEDNIHLENEDTGHLEKETNMLVKYLDKMKDFKASEKTRCKTKYDEYKVMKSIVRLLKQMVKYDIDIEDFCGKCKTSTQENSCARTACVQMGKCKTFTDDEVMKLVISKYPSCSIECAEVENMLAPLN